MVYNIVLKLFNKTFKASSLFRLTYTIGANKMTYR